MKHHDWKPLPLISGIALLCLIVMVQPVGADITDPAYHTLEEVYEEIFALQEQYPDRMKIDSIGHSQQEKLPIYAIWSTNNDDTDGDARKPSVIYNGQVHAEEVLGVEYCMWLLNRMVAETREALNWRRRVHTYIIPTANPEGLRAVFEFDNTFRKNKRDNIGDGRFRYLDGWGNDTSGVDINRNFPTFWINGDKFLVKGTNEYYDYYRGPAPASEAETRALISFYEKIRPLYSATIHSSRTGNYAEKVIYPWGFGQETKLAPDIAFMDELVHQVARRCETLDNATYEPNRSLNPRGDSEAFYYYAFGTFGFRIEIGGEGASMQPPSEGIYQVINDVSAGLDYLLNSAAEITSDDYGDIRTSWFDIRVIDSSTSQPLGARLKMDKLSTPLIPYRTTNPLTGLYYWLSYNGYHDWLTVSIFGYESRSIEVSAGANRIRMDVRLEPLSWYQVNLNVSEFIEYDEDTFDPIVEPILTPVDLSVIHEDSSWSTTIYDGHSTMQLPEGNYWMTFTSGISHVPKTEWVRLRTDTTWSVTLNKASVLFSQTFDGESVVHSADNVMNVNGIDSLARWELTDDICHTPPRCLTDSRRGNTIRLEDSWDAPYNILDESFNLSGSRTAALVFWLNQALEPGYDSMWVEVSTGGSPGSEPSTWQWEQVSPAFQELAILNWQDMDDFANRAWNAYSVNLMRFHDWQHVVVDLDDYLGEEELHFRFHLKSDGYDTKDGVYIDDVYLLASKDRPIYISSVPVVPSVFTMGEPYPNPFNGQLRFSVNLPEDSDLEIKLYDLMGRLSMVVPTQHQSAGTRWMTLNAGGLATGLYFLKVSALNREYVKKVMLVR